MPATKPATHESKSLWRAGRGADGQGPADRGSGQISLAHCRQQTYRYYAVVSNRYRPV